MVLRRQEEKVLLMKAHKVLARALLFVFATFGGTLALAADWPQFLGPHRDGVSSETGLRQTWPAGGPPVV